MLGGRSPVRIELWDGSAVGPPDGPGVVKVKTPDALRRILWSPNELGIGRAYVAGDIEIEGDVHAMVGALSKVTSRRLRRGWRAVPAALRSAYEVGAIGPPLPPPPEEARPRGLRHSLRRDAQVITYHYDVSNEFYRLVLGPSMTYSCARFVEPSMSLESAQSSKHDLICRKLGLHLPPPDGAPTDGARPDGAPPEGARLLDVGCGWGSMAIHAASHYGTRVVGITLSHEQAALARKRVAEAGVGDKVEIRVQDYRKLRDEKFAAISSVGMFEHVGRARAPQYFETMRSLLVPRGRLLNHAISRAGGSRLDGRTFIGRYVFPDGELIDVGDVVLWMEGAGFEVRDVESLREHYARTLRAWVANLEEHWEQAVALVGLPRAKVWRLYMAASAVGFEDGGIGIHQVLGVIPDEEGGSGMPRTRTDWR